MKENLSDMNEEEKQEFGYKKKKKILGSFSIIFFSLKF